MYPRQKEVIWSSNLAYCIGLITTDGSLSSDGRHIDFTSNDKDLIRTFKSCLNLKNRIYRKKSGFTGKMTSYRIQFGNVTLYKWLIKIGLMPNKSKRLKSLQIPKQFFFDFLRGHLDGDGSVLKYFDPIYPNSKRLYLNFYSASLPHLIWLKEEIKTLTGLQGSLSKSVRSYRLQYSKQASIELLDKLYYTLFLPCLQRKRVLAKEYLYRRGDGIGRHA